MCARHASAYTLQLCHTPVRLGQPYLQASGSSLLPRTELPLERNFPTTAVKRQAHPRSPPSVFRIDCAPMHSICFAQTAFQPRFQRAQLVSRHRRAVNISAAPKRKAGVRKQCVSNLQAPVPNETFTPETFTPGTFTPGTFTPEAFTPDALTPEALSPEAYTPIAPPAYVLVGSVALVIPFVVAAVLFGERILRQRACKTCQGSGLVQSGARVMKRCSE